MTTSDHGKSHQSWLFVGLVFALGASACTREDADAAGDRVRQGADRVKESAERIKEKLPPAHEVRDELKQAGQEAGDTMRKFGNDVVHEAKATRDLIRERTQDDRRTRER
ncbi:MAG: hypothetical protein RL701_2334 [Pseudomonadota bacterium]